MDTRLPIPDIPRVGRSPEILTFGCRLNAYESQVMRELASSGNDDLVIVNTCTVTNAAERQARQAIRRTRRERPGARIVVTGCAAQISPHRFAAMPEVDQVIGNHEKMQTESWAPDADRTTRVRVGSIDDVREAAAHLIAGFETHTRAFVQVQNGCDHRCTFCIIPYGRGPSRSVAPEHVVDQVRLLAEAGVGEVVLSGVDLTAYGEDLPARPLLGSLVRRLLREVPHLPRLRLSSVDPVEIDDDLWTALEHEPRLMPHLHLSLQAGDDVVLKRMKRRHLRDDARAVVERARRVRPDIVFGADLIAGFPTETEEMFAQTLMLVEELDLVYLHVFPYSPRPETPAARMPQLAMTERKVRAARLRAVGARAQRQLLETKIGTVQEVLMEVGDVGRTRDFACVRIEGGAPAGAFLQASVHAVDDDTLIGRPAARATPISPAEDGSTGSTRTKS